MNTPSLYDLTPVLHVMLMGVVLATGPLAWVWLRNRDASATRRLHALTLLTLFLTFDLVMFGAFTRLTDSGLGCPDWPGCYGNASPVGAQAEITAAQTAMPTGPVTHGKAWIEMIHRYLATAVGVLILVLAAASWTQRRRSHDHAGVNPWWATVTLIWVAIQGAFGALTVTMKLFPAIVTLHLLGGVALLVLLCLQALHYAQHYRALPAVNPGRGLMLLLATTYALVAVQLALGGWVSTNYAVLACTEFPMCQSSWWPEMNFAQGFTLWRELGLTPDGQHISFAALTAVHYVHRLMAYAVLLLLALLVWRMKTVGAWHRPARWLAVLTALQFLTGLSNVVLDWPLVAAVLHTGGAAALVVVLTWALATTRLRAGSSAALPPSDSRPPA
jgi:cytochrome c oxidase assembly protein subunit 15